MGVLSWLLLGLFAGIVARWLLPGPDGGGLLWTLLLGVAGAFDAGFLGSLAGVGGVASFDLGSLALAAGGAVLLLGGHRALRAGPS